MQSPQQGATGCSGQRERRGEMFDSLNVAVKIAGTLQSLETRVAERLRRNDGQAFVEYVLVLTLVAVAVALLAQWTNFTTTISSSLQRVINALTSAGTSS
jgi:Flp pilus assembly pilin Flp